MLSKKVLDRFRIEPGEKFRLEDHDPRKVTEKALKRLGKDELKDRAKEVLAQNLQELSQAQAMLWANDVHSVLIVLQAMDAAGKDGVIRHVMSGVNPQGCRVHNFKQPSSEELDHDFLWRSQKALPERGMITIFNRSYYEEVLACRVHPEYLDKQRLPQGKRDEDFWRRRYESINDFERHLTRNGTVVLKFFLNVSKGEQKRRFLERIEEREKHWKFSAADIAERRHWDAYMDAFEQMVRHTTTKHAPWHVIPADHKWVARALIADYITNAVRDLHDGFPEPSEAQMKALAAARKELLGG
jgi:PPK2 family polyphosphate:nucleotide phosphotransferase